MVYLPQASAVDAFLAVREEVLVQVDVAELEYTVLVYDEFLVHVILSVFVSADPWRLAV